jgi:hypothetical protein
MCWSGKWWMDALSGLLPLSLPCLKYYYNICNMYLVFIIIIIIFINKSICMLNSKVSLELPDITPFLFGYTDDGASWNPDNALSYSTH